MLACFALGAVSVSAWAPLQLWPVLFLTLGGLYALIGADGSIRRAFSLGMAFGLGLFLAGVSWVYVSLSLFSGLPAALAAISTLLFCLFLAVFPGLAMAAFVRFRTASPARNILLFAALLALADWVRGWILTGFPWLALGYSQTSGGIWEAPLQGFAPLVGVFGVSALVALCGAVAGEWISGLAPSAKTKVALPCFFCKWALLALAALLLSAGIILKQFEWTNPSGDSIRVALLQGNVEQDMKWSPARYEDTLRLYYELAEKHPAQLTVLPETALPTFFDQLPGSYLRLLKGLTGRVQGAQGQGGDIVIGSAVGDARQYSNSVVSLGAAPMQRYDKSHLVPFGEYTPPGFSWFMRWLNIPMSGFTPGKAAQAPFELSGQKIAFNICYEDVFGDEIARAAEGATILINVSNTAWFGRSLAQPQHLQIAQMRALETGRPMLRATNTGMTAVILPTGQVQAVLPAFTRDALVAQVQGTSGQTPFVRMGNWGALALIFLFSLPALVSRQKSR